MNLDGRRALVTGGGRRIGRAICLALAGGGARVAIHCNTSREDARTVQAQCPGSIVVEADLADRDARRRLLPEVRERLGGLDILVNNAAMYVPRALEDVDEALWDRTFEVNCTAPFFLAREAGLEMSRAGGGVIVNLIDWGIDRPHPSHLPYYAAKAALGAATAGLARALAPRVRVNAVAPGPILPGPGESDRLQEEILAKTPLGRLGGVESIATTVIFLACNDFVTGATIRVDGGRSLN